MQVRIGRCHGTGLRSRLTPSSGNSPVRIRMIFTTFVTNDPAQRIFGLGDACPYGDGLVPYPRSRGTPSPSSCPPKPDPRLPERQGVFGHSSPCGQPLAKNAGLSRKPASRSPYQPPDMTIHPYWLRRISRASSTLPRPACTSANTNRSRSSTSSIVTSLGTSSTLLASQSTTSFQS